jgi:hypothetical protein
MHYLDTIAGMSPGKAWTLYGIKAPGWEPEPYRQQLVEVVVEGATLRQRPPPPSPVAAPPVVAAPVVAAPRRVRRRTRFDPETDKRLARPYGVSGVTRLLVGWSRGGRRGDGATWDRTGRDDERWRRSYDRSRQLTL